MVYFTEEQQRVLKTAWIPVLLALFFSVPSAMLPRETWPQLNLQASSFALMMAFLLSWDLGVRSGAAKGLTLLGISLVALFVLTLLPLYLGFSVFVNPMGLRLPVYAFFFVMVTARYFLVDTPKRWPLIFTGTAILMFMPNVMWAIFWFLVPYSYGSNTQLMGIPAGLETVTNIFQVYTVFFIAENYRLIPGYINKLRSKLQLLGKAEFTLLFFAMLFMAMAAVSILNYTFNSLYLLYRGDADPFFGRQLPVFLIQLPVFACWLVFSAYFLRNIVVARCLTIHIAYDLYYVLHYIPVVNIIAFLFSVCSSERSQSVEENAMLYLYTSKKAARVVTFVVAIISALAGAAWVINISYYYVGNYAVAFVMFISLLSLGLLALAARFKAFVYILVGFNVLVLLFIRSNMGMLNGMFFYITYAYMQFYFLTETFHPELSGEDALAAPLANRIPG